MKFCPECGAPISETNKFCPNCGHKIDRNEQASIHSIPTAPGSQPESTGDAAVTAEEESQPARPARDASGLPPAWMPPPVQPGTGTPLTVRETVASAKDDEADDDLQPPSFMPPPVNRTFAGGGGLSSVDDDFKMSDLGPPPPPKRRLWLWIPLGVIAFVITCCIVFVVLSETVLEDTFDRWATEIATDSTEEAVEP